MSCDHAVTAPPCLLCFGPDNVLQIGCKAFADPLLSPVFGSNDQAEPGVRNLVANSGAAQGRLLSCSSRSSSAGTPSVQHTLGQENYMGAEERKMIEENDEA